MSCRSSITVVCILALIPSAIVTMAHAQDAAGATPPVPLIFDTDLGNDVDDVLALGVIHALESRGECKLLSVTVSKDNPLAARFCDLVDTFYGRGDIPIGKVRDGKTPEEGKFVRGPVTAVDDGRARYPHDITGGDGTPEAAMLLRKVLAAQPKQSVVIVVIGFSTNLARLLQTGPDDASPLSGRELVAEKVRLLSMMGGHFGSDRPADFQEYNIHTDLEAAGRVFAEWPTPIVISGYEIGLAITYPAESIQRDYNYVPHHPLKEAYELYLPMPYDRPCWDLTSVLHAVRPDRGYFGLSPEGELKIGAIGCAIFEPGGHGRHRYLTANSAQIVRAREALVQLASQPPDAEK